MATRTKRKTTRASGPYDRDTKGSKNLELGKINPISPTELTKAKIEGQWVTHKQCAYIDSDYYAIFFNSGVNLPNLMPLLNEDNELEDGVYTWVILSLKNEKPIMYLKKTLTSYEFGTKHQEILYQVTCRNMECDNYKLYYAGELLKEGNNINFNLESGTYMKDKLNPKKNPTETIVSSKIQALGMIDERLNKTGNLNIEQVEGSFITHDSIPLTENDLKIYNFFGAKIYKFTDHENCKKFTGRGKVTLNELNGKLVNFSSIKSGGTRSNRKSKLIRKESRKSRKGRKGKKVRKSKKYNKK